MENKQRTVFTASKIVQYVLAIFLAIIFIATLIGSIYVYIQYKPVNIFSADEAWKLMIILAPLLPIIIGYSYLRTYTTISIIENRLKFEGVITKTIEVSPTEIVKIWVPYNSGTPYRNINSTVFFVLNNGKYLFVSNGLNGMLDLIKYIKTKNPNVEMVNERLINEETVN